MAPPAQAARFHLLSLPHSSHGPAAAIGDYPQFNGDLHLVHTVAGHAALHIDDHRYETSPQCVIAVPMGVRCTWKRTLHRPWEMINLHYRVALPDGSPIEERYTLPISFRPAGLPAIHARLRRLQRAWLNGDALAQFTVSADLHSLVARYWRQFASPVDSPVCHDPVVLHLCSIIRRQATRPFDAAALAAAVGLSPSQMNRRFRAGMSLSPKTYWQQHRVAAVRAALYRSDEPLEHLAPSLGFNDVYYFCRWFRQQTGMTPGACRRQSRLTDF